LGKLLEKLDTERGIVVVTADKRHGKFFISGLRDPLAADPLIPMKSANLSPAQVTSRWENYLSEAPKFIEARAKQVLQPPKSVSLKVSNNAILFVLITVDD
jgi:OOP family OmpA-OmpF porin